MNLKQILCSLVAIYIQARFSQNRCDSCFHLSLKVHRCSSCKTKVYCSAECQAEDWKVHKFCCEELRKSHLHQATKGKEGSDDRKLTGVKNTEKLDKRLKDLKKELKNELTEVD